MNITLAAPRSAASALPAPSPRPRLRGLTAEAVFVGRSLRHSLRDGESLLMAIMLPVMLMLMFTWVFGGAIDPSGAYVDYVVPGIILTCAGFGASSTAVYVANDMRTGIIDRFRTMPLRAGAVLTGHVVASVLRNLIATAIVIGVGVLVGFRPSASAGEWVGLAALIALYILAITYLFAAIGLAAGSPEGANGYGFVLLFLPYLSSAFVPVASMPEWLQPVAANQPITPIVETIRGLLTDAPVQSEAWWAIGWCVVILAIAVAWGAWLFRRKAGRR
ncbi:MULTISPECIES: ABC transporter permease [unclassified Microbacterium]|uniref:ABC transporter permease n=1 Tax=unclassified Microbacterium TaxID=2609290 RepID=UPI000492FF3A|nr:MULTISPECIES: ABC transporter permease [unclassified Microbacterium]MCV0335498.1 ABC transporter permease [Microbacterium sp.]MCV0376036.1 ABC transporter permease [Microbacterium sp.]MCV0390292.1 ABC transporter permease [Microbacterium sp.]MCV0418027.1 ABC transporter permease [Microbacterium sp.]MCV0422305.1 ABC transporter permease [Microbacterium sp.]